MTWSIALALSEGRSAGSQEGFGNHSPLGSWDTPSPRRVKSHRVFDTPIGDARNTNKKGERELKSPFHSIRCYETHCEGVQSTAISPRSDENSPPTVKRGASFLGDASFCCDIDLFVPKVPSSQPFPRFALFLQTRFPRMPCRAQQGERVHCR